MMSRKISLFLALFLLVALTTACDEGEVNNHSMVEDIYAVDPLFREFYNYLGGNDVLGPVISVVYIQDEVKYQFTQNALMVYDPAAPANMHFQLSSLGLEMGVQEPGIPPPAEPEAYYVDGHVVYKEFVSLYEKLGGARFVGRPLTGVLYNPEEKRNEQYFENLGFYRRDGDAPGNVRLLAYGAWMCDSSCRSAPPEDSLIVVTPLIEPPFNDLVARLGLDFTGFALSEAYPAADGKLEKVFANVVLAADAGDPGSVHVRPLLEKINMLPEPPTDPSTDPNMVFFAIQGNKGYNVPTYFMDYIANHGGLEISGLPISELRPSGTSFRQCFTNLCLVYDPSAIAADQVRPDPIGYTYRQMYNIPVPNTTAAVPGIQQVSLQAWETYPAVTSTEQQEIGASVVENNQPLAGVQPQVALTMPDGTSQVYLMPPTGADGVSLHSVPPVAAANGTLIPYQVCITGSAGETYCVKDSYLIWNNP